MSHLTAETISRDLHERATDAVEHVKDAAESATHQATEALHRSTEAISRTAHRLGERGLRSGRQASDQVRTNVESHPIASTALIVATMVLVGLALTRSPWRVI